MIIEKIATGATIEEAYDAAKKLLNAPEDAFIEKEILEYPKKRLFSRVPAKIKVWYELPDAPAAEPVRPAPAAKQEERKAAPSEKKPSQPSKKSAVSAKKPAQAKPARSGEAVTESQEDASEAKAEVRVPYDIPENDGTLRLLKLILKGMCIEEYEITGEKVEESDEIIYNVSCGDADGALIGRRGETLDSIQYLLRLALNKGIDDDKHRKVSVNVGNYREKRNDNLRALAAKNARQVLKYGRNAVLEPMNPYERRIIHTAIQGIDGVTSHSVGSDGNRKVVISLEEGVQPTHPSRGGYNNRGRGGYNKGGYNNRGGNRGGKGGYQKREPYKPAVTREPRKDTAGSLYGRIDLNIPPKTEE